ncbi:MAG: hypothetical protein IH597_00295 [Bacteroidales bacterium]|nr:hypothetical protein [Bacteroidales bacterium]
MKSNLKRKIAIVLLLASASTSAQQTPWVTFFGGPGPQFATDIRQTSDNGYIIAAYDSENYSANYYIVKLDEAGNLEWETNISKDNYSERAYSVIETSTGDFVVTGTATMLSRPWIVKLNSLGDTLWTSQWTNDLPQNSAVIARAVLLPDNRIVVIGAEGQLGSQPNMFLVSQEGALLEQRTLNAPVPPGWYSGTIVTHVEPASDGGFLLTGSAGGGSSSKAFLWKFDQNADSVWTKLYNEHGMRAANSVKQLADGGYIMVGFSSPNSEHSCAIRVDQYGEVIWSQTYPDNVYTQATDVIEWTDGTFLITEIRFEAFGETIFESALLKIDGDGNLLNRDIITANDASVAIYRMRGTNDGGFVMAGEINEMMVMNEQDLFVLKSDPLGDFSNSYFNILLSDNIIKSDVNDIEIRILPNPVRAGSEVYMFVPDHTRSIGVYSLTGSKVHKIDAEHNRLNGFTAPDKKGIYIVRVLLSSGEAVNKRLVVI